jgi:hypothetical protein
MNAELHEDDRGRFQAGPWPWLLRVPYGGREVGERGSGSSAQAGPYRGSVAEDSRLTRDSRGPLPYYDTMFGHLPSPMLH